MNALNGLVDFILHIDTRLDLLLQDYGLLTYAILFLIVFVETGLVVMPFLPGDSLLFAAGAFAGRGSLELSVLLPLLFVAAVAGDALNYMIGHAIGRRLLNSQSKWIKTEYIERTRHFYERHGKKTIVLARFVPIVRTIAPFVAGIGTMPYRIFALYNLLGGLLWIVLFLLGGYFFGSLPIVEHNFSLVILAIIAISLVPSVLKILRHRRSNPKSGSNPTQDSTPQ